MPKQENLGNPDEGSEEASKQKEMLVNNLEIKELLIQSGITDEMINTLNQGVIPFIPSPLLKEGVGPEKFDFKVRKRNGSYYIDMIFVDPTSGKELLRQTVGVGDKYDINKEKNIYGDSHRFTKEQRELIRKLGDEEEAESKKKEIENNLGENI